jgi:hypothetical protein
MQNDYTAVITLNRQVAASVVMTVFRRGEVEGVAASYQSR